MAPQLFVGVSLGAGINKFLENNSEPQNLFELIQTPDIYFPIIGIIVLVFVGIILRKFFFN